MELLYTFLAIFPIAFISPYIVRQKSTWGWTLALVPAAIFILLLRFVTDVSHGHTEILALNWLPTLDISLMLYIDGLSLLFALIISFIGFLIIIYASGYFHHNNYAGRFYMIVLLFMGAMLGVVLAGNLFTMFVFWELTSFTSYLLIGWNHEKEESRWAALQSLIVTGGGGLALFAGLILMRLIVGSFDIADILSQPELIRSHSFYIPVLILVALGAFTKSAQFPFHFWLPGAMAAPTPVSAYLHSATMVKAGIYLLARLNPVLGGTAEWTTVITLVGGLTMVTGAALALPQNDLKKLLAYTTVSALGMITLLIGLGTSLAIKAAMVFLLVHSLYKGSLFMVAGGIDHAAGTRDVRLLSGLGRLLPFTATAGLLAALSMSGLPPFFGFIGKELVYEANLHAPQWVWILTATGLFANAVNVTVAIVVGIRPFWGQKHEKLGHGHEGPLGLWLGPLIAAAAGLLLGLYPAWVAKPLFSPTVSAILAQDYSVKLKLWHGLNTALLLSFLTILVGILLYVVRANFARIQQRLAVLQPIYPSMLFKNGLNKFLFLSDKATRALQNGNLYVYLITIFSVMAAGLWLQVISSYNINVKIDFHDFNFIDLGIVMLMIVATFMAILTRGRLTAVTALGVIGFGVALIYILHGAPDVAITQLVIETLTVVLFVLILYRFPRFTLLSKKSTRMRDASLAVLVGFMMTSLLLMKNSAESLANISPFFVENSVIKAHGHNIVNVILVDFRGIDTLGEITVLSVAALGVYALLKLKMGAKEK
ncbi:putative monovalent cation/H+ antiporter subunit A [candidate division KSB1 bacterium]|nr:putative monovalent cation/H+ antiporter subunit A [candidate division KSB1 bacterium]